MNMIKFCIGDFTEIKNTPAVKLECFSLELSE